MATQVKFHAVTGTLPAAASTKTGDLYFVRESETANYGQLYKGNQLIGAARVTTYQYAEGATTPTIAEGNPAPVRGDINISTAKGAEVFDGTTWKPLSDASLTKRVQDIETVVKAGDKAVGGKSVVQADKVSATDVSATTVSATDGYFINLTVSDTASFNATTVEATELKVADASKATFGGQTIAEIADDQIAAIAAVTKSATDDGITVSVKTESGSVSEVQLEVAGATTVAEFTSEATKVATAKGVVAYVDETLKDINGAMRFYGTTEAEDVAGIATAGITQATGVTETLQPGDVIVSTANGKEYIYDGSAWRELGDDTQIGNIATYVGLANKDNLGKDVASIGGATDLTTAVNNVGASVDAMKTAFTGGDDDDADKGVKVSVATSANSAAPTVEVEVTLTEVSAGSTDDEIPSAKGVYDFVTGEINDLSSTVTAKDAETGAVVEISVTETSGVLTSATVTVAKATEIADADNASDAKLATEKAVRTAIDGLNEAITGGSSSMTDNGVKVEVVTASVSAAPTVTVTVDAIEDYTKIVTTEKKVVTAGAVADYVTATIEGLDASVSSSTQTGLQVSVEETNGKLTSVTAELLWLGSDDTVLA